MTRRNTWRTRCKRLGVCHVCNIVPKRGGTATRTRDGRRLCFKNCEGCGHIRTKLDIWESIDARKRYEKGRAYRMKTTKKSTATKSSKTSSRRVAKVKPTKAKPSIVKQEGRKLILRRCPDYRVTKTQLAGFGGVKTRDDELDTELTFKTKRLADKAALALYGGKLGGKHVEMALFAVDPLKLN